jgi:hypothetical protein
MPLLPLGPFCPLHILLSDLVGYCSPLQIVRPFGTLFKNLKRVKHLTQQVQIFKKSAQNGHYFLQEAAIPDWMGCTVL